MKIVNLNTKQLGCFFQEPHGMIISIYAHVPKYKLISGCDTNIAETTISMTITDILIIKPQH